MNRQFRHYTSVIAVLVLVAISTAQLSSVVPYDDNAYSTNSQAQSHNNECEYDGSSRIDCVFNGPVITWRNGTVTTIPPSQISAPQGPPGSLGNDTSQTNVIPHDEYKTKMQEVLKNALKD